MLALLIALLLLYALFLDIQADAAFHHFDRTQAQLCITVGPMRIRRRLTLLRTAHGHELVMEGPHAVHHIRPGQMHPGHRNVFAAALRASPCARHFFLRHTALLRLDGLIRLRTSRADLSAFLSGLTGGALSVLRGTGNIRIRVMPEFFRAHSTVALRCIIRLKLGTIILTAGLLLPALFREQRRHESEGTSNGTSHR